MTRVAMLKVFINSFFIQSSWSFERMQSLGFAAAISPALDEAYSGNEAGKMDALRRHLGFYNAHPYMASPILGAVIRLEEDAAKGVGDRDAGVRFKSRVAGPYSAIGDSFFWGSIRPLASSIGILAALFWGMWAPVIFLAVYNVFHLWMRYRGLTKGYELGEGVVGYLKSLELPLWSMRAKHLAMASVGLSSAVLAWALGAALTAGVPGWRVRALFLAVTAAVLSAVFLLGALFKKGVTVTRLIYVVLVPLILYGVLSD